MREDHRPVHVVVAVHGVYAVKERNPEPGFARPRLTFLSQLEPALRRIVRWIGPTTAEDRAESVFLNVRFVIESAGIHLGHLADFFFQGHLGQQRLDAVGDGRGGIGRQDSQPKPAGDQAEQSFSKQELP